MAREIYQEGIIYSTDASKFNEKNYEAILDTMKNNFAVGFITGYYDDRLSISSVNSYFLHNLGYTYEEFMEATQGSLLRLFCGENQSFLQKDRFQKVQGEGEGQMLTKDKIPVYTHMFKMDSTDSQGRPFWILSAQMDWTQQNLHLVNNVLQSGFWYFDCDEHGKVSKINYSHEFRRMLGYQDVLDFPNTLEAWSALLHPDDKERTLKRLSDALADRTNQTKYDVEYRLMTKDGKYHWFRESAEVTRRLDGTARHMVGIFVNIDKEKKARKKAQRSDAFHRAYTEANLCEYYVDLIDNTFESLKVEDSLLGIFAKSKTWDELIQQYLDHYVCEEDKEAVALLYNRKYILQKLADGNGEVNLECRIQLQGEVRWVRNVVIRDDGLDTSRYVLIFVRDITDAKKEAKHIQELTKQNQAMDLLLQATVKMVDRYAACDLEADTYELYNLGHDTPYAPSGTYQGLVKEMEKHFKLISEKMSLQETFSPAHIRQMIRTPDDIYRLEYCSLDEKQFKALAISPLSWKNGKLEKVLFVAQDTTQEKMMEMEARKALEDAYEAANRANHAKTNFLSNMSHDIRTPMNAIVGMTAIAGANIDNQERVKDCLSKITQSSRHLLGLINEVLDMARIESGRITLTEEEFNLSDLVDNLIMMTKPDMQMHKHHFEVRIHKIDHEDVCGDSLRIQQLITNIISNAIKYTPDGGKITFGIEEIPTHSVELGCYEFTIEDNGVGMSKEFQKIMFQPFTREDDTRTTKIQGTGLGMTIANNIAHMMNGDIRVESEPGKGSKFTITIFLKLQDKEIDRIDELIDLPVLVVDDDQSCCENTVDILNDIGINGEWVTSGKEAVQRTIERYEKGENYFAIIIDWKMPGMDGIETTRQIRKHVGNDVTIIVLSAYDYSDIEEEARAAGVDEFISKPLFRSRLTATFKNIIEGKSAKKVKNDLSDFTKCDYRGKRVLLAEDNELNSEIAKEIISMTGAKVDTVNNGKEAVEKFASAPEGYYSLILMDIQMPVMNGYEATAAIRSLSKGDARQIPIAAMTANAFAEDVLLAKNAGMNEHIAKPLDMNKMYEVLKKWLK